MIRFALFAVALALAPGLASADEATARGRPHYYRVQGPTFLIEFDNSGGNHIHTVWHDFEGDFGRDLLREHYGTHSHVDGQHVPRR